MFLKHTVAIRARGDQCFGSGFLELPNILLRQVIFDFVSDILQHAAATDFIDHGEIDPEEIEKAECFPNTLFFPVSSDAAHTQSIRRFAFLMAPVVLFILSIDISVFFNDLSHRVEEIVVSQFNRVLSGGFDHFLRIYSGRAVDRTVHAGRTAQKGLCHPFRHRELAFHYLFQEDHLSACIGDGPLGQVKDGTDRSAESTPGTLGNGFPLLFVKLKLISHCFSSPSFSKVDKSEILISKSETNPKSQFPSYQNMNLFLCPEFGNLVIRYCFEFRASDFGL
jgi:hypothetical protein